MRFGIEFIPDTPIENIVEWSILAEKMGFDNVWITDHYNNRNLWITLTAIALSTKRVIIGPGVTNPYHTSPALSAAAAVTLNEISEGRAVVGLGAGDRVTLDTLGLEWKKPVTTVIEAIQIMRPLIAGKRLNYEGKVFKFRNAKLANVVKKAAINPDGIKTKKAPMIPIYVGAQGPMMLERTAKLADGILINASHPDDFKEAFSLIKKGCKKANRSVEELDIGAYTAFSIAKSEDTAMKGNTRMVVAFIVAGSPESVLERHGIGPEEALKIKHELQKRDFDMAEKLVTRHMIDSFAIVGNPEYCRNRIEELFEAGVTHFIAGSPIGPTKKQAIQILGKKVLPFFRKQEKR